jgi:hypothetical protein
VLDGSDINAAVTAAEGADAVVLVVGLFSEGAHPADEAEGHDRTSLLYAINTHTHTHTQTQTHTHTHTHAHTHQSLIPSRHLHLRLPASHFLDLSHLALILLQ